MTRILPRGVTMATRRGPRRVGPVAHVRARGGVKLRLRRLRRVEVFHQGPRGPRNLGPATVGRWFGGIVAPLEPTLAVAPRGFASGVLDRAVHPEVTPARRRASIATLRGGGSLTRGVVRLDDVAPVLDVSLPDAATGRRGSPKSRRSLGDGGAVARAPVSDARRSTTDTRCRASRWCPSERCDPRWCELTRARAARVDTSRFAIGSPMWLWSKSWITARCSAACARATYAEHPTSATTPTSAPSRRHVAERCPRAVRERAMTRGRVTSRATSRPGGRGLARERAARARNIRSNIRARRLLPNDGRRDMNRSLVVTESGSFSRAKKYRCSFPKLTCSGFKRRRAPTPRENRRCPRPR